MIQHKQVGLVGVWANGQASRLVKSPFAMVGFEAKGQRCGAIGLKTDDLVLPRIQLCEKCFALTLALHEEAIGLHACAKK